MIQLVHQTADQKTRCILRACNATKCDSDLAGAAFKMLPQSLDPWCRWRRGRRQGPGMVKEEKGQGKGKKQGGREKGGVGLSFYSCTVGIGSPRLVKAGPDIN